MNVNTLMIMAAERLRMIEPEIYEEYEKLLIPPMTDLKLLPIVIDELFNKVERGSENSAFVLAVVYYLYAPFKLQFPHIRLQNGIREILCKGFYWKDRPTVSYYTQICTAYYKNPRWAAKVKEMADYVFELINENKAEILAVYNDGNDGN